MNEKYEGYNMTPEDQKNIEDLMGNVDTILNESVQNNYIDTMREVINQKLLDNSSDFLTNTSLGSNYAVFYKSLIKELPELGLSIVEKPDDLAGKNLQQSIGIKTIPYKTDRDLIQKIKSVPIIKFLVSATLPSKLDEGIKMEEEGILPKDFTKRAILGYYLKKQGDYWKNVYEKAQMEFGYIEPLSDNELEAIIRKAAREEYLKKAN